MEETGSAKGSPQFGTAEYSGSAVGDVCRTCGQPVTGVYYRANNSAILCGSCAERVQREIPKDSHDAFARGLLCGMGGFALGLILYAGFTIATGIEIGFVSLAVGWLVGKAIMLGSGGIGGRRYQIAAVLLTYAAVSLAFIPTAIYYVSKEKKEKSTNQQVQTQQAQKPQGEGIGNTPAQPDADQTSSPAPTSPAQTSPAQTTPSRGALLGKLLLWGLASPFLQLQTGFSGVIGLFILFVGMQFTWKITRGHPKILIDGPYQVSSATKA